MTRAGMQILSAGMRERRSLGVEALERAVAYKTSSDAGSARLQQRWIERPQSGRIEWRQVYTRRILGDQLRQRFAGGGRIEDAPDIVPGRDIEAFALRHLADQRQAILSHRSEAGLPRDDLFWTKQWRQPFAHDLQARDRIDVRASRPPDRAAAARCPRVR